MAEPIKDRTGDRVVILDVETTGLDPSEDRVIEIACLEMVGEFRTGEVFHHFLNPERSVSLEAQRIHGKTQQDLKDKPVFREIAGDFLAFIGDSPLVAHNIGFDSAFINEELSRCDPPSEALDEKRLIDTLAMARRNFPNQRNSLDALCRRFEIPLDRDLHDALQDVELLSEVYVRLKNIDRRADEEERKLAKTTAPTLTADSGKKLERTARPPLVATAAERAAHRDFVETALTSPSLWRKIEPMDDEAAEPADDETAADETH